METRIKHVLLEIYYQDGLDLNKLFSDETGWEELVAKGVSFTVADYELAYAGKDGIVEKLEDFVGFGGEMDVDLDNKNYEALRKKLLDEWTRISQKKIAEAYSEYMQIREHILRNNDD
ncbi:hypothetical protein [Enterococcus sp. LJL51]|uniref:hypothetical protein n=1 Tax=Enterococcus sp. LJL51 TaxID=3416656 RepID=UPI003CEDE856